MTDRPPTDPPFEPMQGTVRWVESGPEVIGVNPELANLMIRVGLASNALLTHRHLSRQPTTRTLQAAQVRDSLCLLVTTSALTNESISLAQENMKVLRRLATQNASSELLTQVGQLCAGKHPASAALARARNKLGFHWDADVVETIVDDYKGNPTLVWFESDANGSEPVLRLASAALAHALIPETLTLASAAGAPPIIDIWMKDVDNAMTLVIDFFAAATFGFFREVGANQRSRADAGRDQPIEP